MSYFAHITRKMVKRRKISENLMETKYEISDARSSDAPSRHYVTYFEITNFTTNGMVTSDETKLLLSSICQIRKLLKARKNSLNLLVQDEEGGIGGKWKVA